MEAFNNEAMTSMLIVKDDATVRDTLALNLRAEGYEVLTAADGEEGLSLARADAPDRVVLDVIFTRPRIAGSKITSQDDSGRRW